METPHTSERQFEQARSYLLGKLIDWKRCGRGLRRRRRRSSYLLGKLIDWKPINEMTTAVPLECSYLLGKLIDWKLYSVNINLNHTTSSYLLGKLIDWKHDASGNFTQAMAVKWKQLMAVKKLKTLIITLRRRGDSDASGSRVVAVSIRMEARK